MYAIIETGGKQYKVEKGSTLEVEKLNNSVGEKLEINKILAIVKDDESILLGDEIKNVKVIAEILEHKKGKKIIVFKFKAKTDYRKKRGHRQILTKIRIDDILIS